MIHLDYSGETSGSSLYFAPGFALGYAALVADFWGPQVAEDTVRLFVAHAYTDTSAYGFSADHWHPWSPATIFPAHSLTTHGWRGPCLN